MRERRQEGESFPPTNPSHWPTTRRSIMRDCEARSCGGECETGNRSVQHGPFVHRSATDATILAESSATLTLGLLQGCPPAIGSSSPTLATTGSPGRKHQRYSPQSKGIPTFSLGQPFNGRRVSALPIQCGNPVPFGQCTFCSHSDRRKGSGFPLS